MAGAALVMGSWACPANETVHENGTSSETDPVCSWATSITGLVLLVPSLVVGPSVGRFYAGNTAQGLVLSGTRLVAAGVGVVTLGAGIMLAFAGAYSGLGGGTGDDCEEAGASCEEPVDYGPAPALLVTTAALHLAALSVLVIADIATTRRAARRMNEARRPVIADVSLTPIAFPGSAGDIGLGLAVHMVF
jgi:hypothetical protein